jgi:uncharacterized protein YcaQ
MTAELSLTEARRIVVAAQGIHVPVAHPGRVGGVLSRLGCIQLDSMSALRRSHELVLLSRGVPLDQAERFGTIANTDVSFEGMAHALSFIPMDLWPAFGFRRRRTRQHGWRGPAVDMSAVKVVQEALDDQGQVRLRDFGKTQGTGWERDSAYRWALEWMAAVGDAVCTGRDRWERVYRLPAQALPPWVDADEMRDDECLRELCRRAIRALGVATTKDVADYFRLRPDAALPALESLKLERRTVSGWREPAWIAPDADPAVKVDEDAATAISPFDSLVWTRQRQERLFGKDYRLEAYKPVAKRTFGYFSLPILRGCDIVGRIALRRRGAALTVENTELDPGVPVSTIDQVVTATAVWTACTTLIREGGDA